jgi:hypothetical protein
LCVPEGASGPFAAPAFNTPKVSPLPKERDRLLQWRRARPFKPERCTRTTKGYEAIS